MRGKEREWDRHRGEEVPVPADTDILVEDGEFEKVEEHHRLQKQRDPAHLTAVGPGRTQKTGEEEQRHRADKDDLVE